MASDQPSSNPVDPTAVPVSMGQQSPPTVVPAEPSVPAEQQHPPAVEPAPSLLLMEQQTPPAVEPAPHLVSTGQRTPSEAEPAAAPVAALRGQQTPPRVEPAAPPTLTEQQPPPPPQEKNSLVRMGKINDPNGRSRTFHTNCEIRPGEVVEVVAPSFLYPASPLTISFFCSQCYRDLPSEPPTCSNCKLAAFCSEKCRKMAHSSLLCNSIQHHGMCMPSMYRDPTWTEDILFLLCAYSLPDNPLLKFLSLHTNPNIIPDDELVGTLHCKLSLMIHPNFIPLHFSPEITSYLLSNKRIHSFPKILNSTHPHFNTFKVGVYAYAIYVQLSALNHSCLPNVCAFDFFDHQINSDVKKIRALHEIQQGAEIFISYIPMNILHCKERKKMLMEQHALACRCMRCETEGLWMEKQDEEQQRKIGGKKKNKRKEGRRKIGGADWGPHTEFLKNHICDCGGCLAPFPPYHVMAGQNLMECNSCGRVRTNEQAIAEVAQAIEE